MQRNRVFGLTKRLFVYSDFDIIKKLFIACVWPHLEYENIVTHPQFKKDVEHIQ